MAIHPTTLEVGDVLPENVKSAIQFQFTPLRERRPRADKVGVSAPTFQFTPLRERRRLSPLPLLAP